MEELLHGLLVAKPADPHRYVEASGDSSSPPSVLCSCLPCNRNMRQSQNDFAVLASQITKASLLARGISCFSNSRGGGVGSGRGGGVNVDCFHDYHGRGFAHELTCSLMGYLTYLPLHLLGMSNIMLGGHMKPSLL